MRFAVLALCAVSVCAQTSAPLPTNFSAAGIAVQNGVTSGWGQACHQAPESSIFGYVVRSMACIASDYRPKGTSARLDLDAVWLHNSRWSAGNQDRHRWSVQFHQQRIVRHAWRVGRIAPRHGLRCRLSLLE